MNNPFEKINNRPKSMDKKSLEQIKQKLLEEKEKLENQLSKFAKQNPDNSDDFQAKFPEIGSEEEENALEIAEYNKDLALEHAFEEELDDINGALERLKKGEYGICKYCKKPIPEKRLIVRPTSSSCVECKKGFTRI